MVPPVTAKDWLSRARVGDFDVDLSIEFFCGFVNHAGVTLHIDNLRGINAHHQIETVFKAFGRALRMALTIYHELLGPLKRYLLPGDASYAKL